MPARHFLFFCKVAWNRGCSSVLEEEGDCAAGEESHSNEISKLKKRGKRMRLCISSSGSDISSAVDPRFGRCQYFLFVDTETLDVEAAGQIKDVADRLNRGELQYTLEPTIETHHGTGR